MRKPYIDCSTLVNMVVSLGCLYMGMSQNQMISLHGKCFLNRLPFDNTMFIFSWSLSWYVATPSIGHYGIPPAFLPKAVPAFFAVLRGRVPCNVCDQVFVLVCDKPRDQLSDTMYFNWVWGVRIRVHQQRHGWPVSWWGYIRKYVCGIYHGVCMSIKWFVIESLRLCLLLIVVTALGGAWFVEQPEQSVLEYFPPFQSLLAQLFEANRGTAVPSLQWL